MKDRIGSIALSFCYASEAEKLNKHNNLEGIAVGLSINSKYNAGLSRFFSSAILNELLKKGYSAFFKEMVYVSGLDKTIDGSIALRDFLQIIYDHLSINYRSEYIYKNAIANKILLGKHSLNTTYMLTEFRVADCKADAVLINGTSSVYEIKSELDSMERLQKQISAYEKVFDMIHVITAPSQIAKVELNLPTHVGILSLNQRNSISTIRDAQSMKHSVVPEVIFDSLRKPEYTAIIKELYGTVPIVPNTQFYMVCRDLFGNLSPEVAHDSMVRNLKKRCDCKLLKEFIDASPDCLSAYALSLRSNIKETIQFKAMLDTEYKTFII